jgi:hypothetical protein
VYHLELRQFPHNFCHFNLTAQGLRETVLDAWARGEWVEVGERRWNPQQATLTVLEGPELPLDQLSMGRGWRNALRHGADVTADVLADAQKRLGVEDTASADAQGSRKASVAKSVWAATTGPMPEVAGGPQSGGVAGPGGVAGSGPHNVVGSELHEEALARHLLYLLGESPGPLLRAWQLASEQHPDRTPSQCLASAEDFVGR